MKSQEIREIFLDFFAKKKHKIIKSSSLLPQDDPTILFTNAGMNQFKNIFLGLEKRSYNRATSVQKCMRVSGKHNDLEEVGRTSKHHTFFEMLGNFSFGDYFKKGAIEYGWELITQVFKMSPEKLYVTVYEEDDEAFDIWNKDIGIPNSQLFRFGKKDNYWSMGETGPCGPCSEIHYDLDPAIEKGDPYKLIDSGSDRFLELWNLVFMQFHQEKNGKLNPLPSPSIDTGMGLERMATVLQGKQNNFDTDLFFPLIKTVSDLSSTEYQSNAKIDTSLRIIADHIRAVSFLIGDGIMPSNDGRGYVLRRLIRRAYRQGNSLGIEEPFLYKLVGVVCDIMKDAYPELLSSAEYISKVCLSEERRFASTLSSGLKTFSAYIDETKKSNKKKLSGSKVFKLYDTFGFPLDLSRELAEEFNLTVDEAGFIKELEKQRDRARLSWDGSQAEANRKIYEKLKDLSIRFTGYEKNKVNEAKVLGIIKDGQVVKEIKSGETAQIFLDETPFYAEAGGQVGDSGVIQNPHFSALVETTYFVIPEIIAHKAKILSGKLRVGDTLEASIDPSRRNSARKNHTATHLLHAALRQSLGDHIKQAGSLVSPSRLRFDFTHFSPIDISDLKHIETVVYEKIMENLEVNTRVLTLEEGIEEGAIAIFEEKYGETVRMVTIKGYSKELCGGIHVQQTGEIGSFKIISESSIAAGMRRIEALTGEEALKYNQETDELLTDVQHVVNCPRKDIIPQIEKIQENLKQKEKENRSLRQKLANITYDKQDDRIQMINGIKVMVQKVEGLNNNELRELADSLKQKIGSGIIILGSISGEKVFLVSAVSKDITSQIKANEIIKELAPLVGGGGGRPDFAQAGGTQVHQLSHALKKSGDILNDLLHKQ